MATLTIPNSFVAATVILSAEVNANFNAGATFLNTTKINFDNIQDSGVTTAKIADGAITTAKILDANVTTAKILDANVTTAKIADSAVTTVKIADLNVTEGKLAAAFTAKVFPQHSIYVSHGNGYGSAATMIRRYLTVDLTLGTAITYATSATNGDTFTIAAGHDGLYSISTADLDATSTSVCGISVNNLSPTTPIGSLSYGGGFRASASGPAGQNPSCSITIPLAAGDIIRSHQNGASTDNTGVSWFSITKIASKAA